MATLGASLPRPGLISGQVAGLHARAWGWRASARRVVGWALLAHLTGSRGTVFDIAWHWGMRPIDEHAGRPWKPPGAGLSGAPVQRLVGAHQHLANFHRLCRFLTPGFRPLQPLTSALELVHQLSSLRGCRHGGPNRDRGRGGARGSSTNGGIIGGLAARRSATIGAGDLDRSCAQGRAAGVGPRGGGLGCADGLSRSCDKVVRRAWGTARGQPGRQIARTSSPLKSSLRA